MNILIINANHPLYASGIVGMDLFYGFQNKGHKVRLLVNTYDRNYPEGTASMESFLIFWRKRITYKFQRILGLNKNIRIEQNYQFHGLKEGKHYFST